MMNRFVDTDLDFIEFLPELRDAEWEEQKHPRDDHGRFGPAEGLTETAPGWVSTKHLLFVQKNIEKIAAKMDYPPGRIDIVDKEPPEFIVGNLKFKEAGHYDPATRRIEVNARTIKEGDSTWAQGLAAHEIMHAQYDHVTKVQKLEHDEIRTMFDQNKEGEFFKRNGYPRPEKIEELYAKYPASAAFAKTWGDGYLGGSKNEYTDWQQNEMVADNGHTEYAKSYWQPEAVKRYFSDGTTGLTTALNETLAESARYETTFPKSSWKEAVPKPLWLKFSNDIRQAYRLTKHRMV